MRILFLLPPAAAGLAFLAPPSAAEHARFSLSLPTGSALRAAAGATPQQLYVRARTVAVQVRTGVAPELVESTRREMELGCAALAAVPEARSLPWQAWVQENAPVLPEFAASLFRSAASVQGRAVLDWAGALDQRGTPSGLRLELLRAWWDLDQSEAANRTAKLLSEAPRGNDPFLAEVVRQVLVPRGDPRTSELLLRVARKPSADSLARRSAIEELGRRPVPEYAHDLEAIFLSEAVDLTLQQAALEAVCRLSPALGRQLLMDRVPDPGAKPELYDFMARMRREQGLPELPYFLPHSH